MHKSLGPYRIYPGVLRELVEVLTSFYLIVLYSYVKGGYWEVGIHIFSQLRLLPRNRRRGNGLKLHMENSRWVLGKTSSLKACEALEQASRVESPSLGVFRGHVDVTQWWTQWFWVNNGHCGFFQPKRFYGSILCFYGLALLNSLSRELTLWDPLIPFQGYAAWRSKYT